jgi:Fic family protein
MQQLNIRQQQILDFILKEGKVSNSEIVAFLGNKISRFTILRDLDLLLKERIIKRNGKGRNVNYSLFSDNAINAFFDVETYFKKGPDERNVKIEFNDNIIKELSRLFSEKDIKELNEVNDEYLRRVRKINKTFLKKEIERLTIELSWKSSKMEGNTYSLIDTEILIKDRKEALGHNKEESIMILNHKNTIDYIFNNKKEFEKIDLFQIEKIHELLTRGLNINKGIRDNSVRITGTRYLPIKGKSNIVNALNLFIGQINSLKDPFSKALGLILMIAYIQPFEDGNKRTARILGNGIMLANNVCPISYRSIDEADYKKGIVIFYEQNSAYFFKELFIEQFKFAVNNYF